MKWLVVSLADALASAEVFSDGDWVESKDQDPCGDVRLIQLADVGDRVYLDKSTRFLTKKKAHQLRCTFLESGDILLARMPDPLGRACIFPGDPKACVTVVDVCIIRPNPLIVDSRWLMHCLNTPLCREQIAGYATGTTRTRISRGNLGKIQIPLPSLPEQRLIAEVLDKAEELRTQRLSALRQVEKLPEAIWVEMFGDPILNRNNWPLVDLVETCCCSDDIKCGPFGTQLGKHEYKSSGVPLWGIKNVNVHFTLPTHEFLDDRTAARLMQYSILPGDIVMTRKGTIGNCAVYPDDYQPGIMHSDLLRLRTDPGKCSPVFLSHQLHYSKDVERQLLLISGGAVMPGINVTKLKNLKILLPPIFLQNEFSKRVSAVEKLKAAHRASLAELDALFASLEHRAFRGEL